MAGVMKIITSLNVSPVFRTDDSQVVDKNLKVPT